MRPERPIITIASVVRLMETTRPTAAKAVAALIDAGVLEETSGRKRDQSFGYAASLDQLKAGTGLDGRHRRDFPRRPWMSPRADP